MMLISVVVGGVALIFWTFAGLNNKIETLEKEISQLIRMQQQLMALQLKNH